MKKLITLIICVLFAQIGYSQISVSLLTPYSIDVSLEPDSATAVRSIGNYNKIGYYISRESGADTTFIDLENGVDNTNLLSIKQDTLLGSSDEKLIELINITGQYIRWRVTGDTANVEGTLIIKPVIRRN